MKAYERLNVEVVKFEAQDVITASVAAPETRVECICDGRMTTETCINWGVHQRCIDSGYEGTHNCDPISPN